MSNYPHTFTEADALLTGRTPNRRKVDHNTYAERRDNGSIAVKLHATDVVTFHPDGSLSLNSGGWLTVTTKDRMNKALPRPFGIYSDQGRWFLIVRPWGDHDSPDTFTKQRRDASVPYADGMVIRSDGTVIGADEAAVAREDAANAKVRKDIARFVKGVTPEAIVTAFEDSGGDCFLCRFGQTSCLASHVDEGYFHATLARNAIAAAGYRSPDVIMHMAYSAAQRGRVDSLLTRDLAKYLRKNLVTGVAVA